jgi:protoporphyrinogen oxidase
LTQVTVVGGGLAGMTAALSLLELGCQVSLFDAGVRVGGKAGANLNDGHRNDHGYHIFPAWYLNCWRLVDELGIRDNFVDINKLSQLKAGEFPRFTTLEGITSPKNAFRNLWAGFIPPHEMFLFFYAGLDLASRPNSRRARLDQLSITGFLRSRFYSTGELENQFHELLLKAITVPSYTVSAMTVRKVARFWLRYPTPTVRILNGDLQTHFIEPLRRRLEGLGCRIELGRRLVRIEPQADRVARLHLQDAQTETTEILDVDQIILAIPPERLTELVDDALFAAAPQLGNILYLRSQPMVALDIYLTRKIAELPRYHLNLTGARYGLSVIDVSKVWDGESIGAYSGTVLNAIASNAQSLLTLSANHAAELLLAELMRYIPFTSADIDRYVLQTHEKEPLFVNGVGAWAYRPDTTTELSNLHLAGDYCRSWVDLVSMEAAITSGLKAAESLRRRLNIGKPIVILEASVYPDWLLRLGKWVLAPVALAARFAVFLGSKS